MRRCRIIRVAIIITLLLPSIFFNSSVIKADDLDNIIFHGTVRDSADAFVASATLTVRHVQTGLERTAHTDAEGRYRILATEPGTYIIRVSAPGFREEMTGELKVTSGRSFAMDFTLVPAGLDVQMVVGSATAPLVDTSRTVVGDSVTKREIEELPLFNRDILQMVFLLAGVAEAPLSTSGLAEEGKGVFARNAPEEAGIFSLTGAPATSNNITIDGLDNNDDRSARERIALSPETVEEAQVITNQYAAEYGRASGGRVNLRTRSGANRFRGESYFYFSDESLNANSFFRNARGLKRLSQQERREGAVFSGPLKRERVFFLAGYERVDIPDSEEIRALVPIELNPLFPLPKPNQAIDKGSSVGLFFDEVSTPETRNLFNARADFNLSDSHNLTARFDFQRGENRRGFPGGNRLLDTLLVQGRDSDSISLTHNFVISATVVNQARFQYSRLLPRNSSDSVSAGVIIEEPGRIIAGAFTGSQSAPATARTEQRAQVQDSLNLSFGSHQFKTGVDAQFVRSRFTDLFATGGQYTFETVKDFLASRPSRFIQRFDTESTQANDVVGLFVQDEWKAKPNLTLSFGLRWDSESILDDRNNISPRVSIALDPFGFSESQSAGWFVQPGKTVIRAGFGIFYNRALLRTIDDFSLGRSTAILDSDIAPEILSAIEFPNPVADRNLIERFGLSETEFLRRISPELEIPYTIQTGFGIERELSRNLAVTLDYIFTRGAHLWRESNINAPRLPDGFANFTEYLLSRDFDNRPNLHGVRPITGTSADIVRFDLSANSSSTPGAVRIVNGLRVLMLGLNTIRSTNIAAALRAIRSLRPDPDFTQIEMLESTGNSFYHGGSVTVKYSLGDRIRLRGVYTLSKFIDEGTTNTASPQNLFDRRAERERSLQDARHRFTVSGQFRVPYIEVDLAPVISFGSSRPFNIGAGFDRNLNDISNDRPDFVSPLGRPVWRRPGSAPADEVKAALRLAPIGSSGSLPRNYGRGPGTRAINLRASRTFAVKETIRIRPAIDVFNVFNNTVFAFGAEFIDRDDADFLIPRRTQRPRSIQMSLKISF